MSLVPAFLWCACIAAWLGGALAQRALFRGGAPFELEEHVGNVGEQPSGSTDRGRCVTKRE